jgi:phosphatidylinositol alpha-mannosyltransferase
VRIVVTCDWFLKYASCQSEALARAGANVMLLCRDHATEFSGDAGERQQALSCPREAGVEVVEIPRRLWDPRALPQLTSIRRRIGRFAPDVIHLHDGADPRGIGLLPPAPTVLEVHDPVPHPGQPFAEFGPKRWFLDRARRAWSSRAAVIAIHSEHLRHELRLRDGQRCIVIPLGLELRDRPLPVPASRKIGLFGRLAPYKGLAVLAGAMPRVWARRPEVRLHVAGSGASELPLADTRVQVDRRYVPEAEIENFFAGLSISVLPYTQASQSGSGTWSVGFGVPVIASCLGGLSDLVLDESYLVEPADEEGLAAAIIRHIDDGDDVRHRVLAEVAAPRSWDAVAARSLAVYRELAPNAA